MCGYVVFFGLELFSSKNLTRDVNGIGPRTEGSKKPLCASPDLSLYNLTDIRFLDSNFLHSYQFVGIFPAGFVEKIEKKIVKKDM